jgi:hypothetical protein
MEYSLQNSTYCFAEISYCNKSTDTEFKKLKSN